MQTQMYARDDQLMINGLKFESTAWSYTTAKYIKAPKSKFEK